MKTIMLCLDGTWNEPDKGKTNVQKLYELVISSDSQVAFYHKGVGTDWWNKISGGLFGFGLFDQIKSAYLDLVNHYQPGDRVITVGFSRGAYAARSLAGFIATCGVLKERRLDLFDWRDKNAIGDLWDLYKDNDQGLAKYIAKECHAPHQDLVEAVAVWDTVGALGVPWNIFPESVVGKIANLQRQLFDFSDTQLNPKVKRGYHAIALDEMRKPFAPTHWQPSDRIEEVWFAGVHSNVGGGMAETGLSDITLRWMLTKLNLNHHIQFDHYTSEESKGVWEMPGITLMDKKFDKVDNSILNTMEERQVPVNARVHSTVQTRMNGTAENSPMIPTARFLGAKTFVD